ncbi:MAG: NADH-quinone oxidoreductase subunit NuoF [Pseudomonadota bacterium]|nr:NADH-quinone oxidoreductase subunit NuoF [Pseudomonadota bacterium]
MTRHRDNTKYMNSVCYRMLGVEQSWTLEAYESMGGYRVWRQIIAKQTPPEVLLKEIKSAVLRGRGGAGFSTGIKMSFISASSPTPRYLVCNSDEGEPGTCKDTLILQFNPHQLIEGMLIACYAQGLSVAYNYLRGEFMHHYQRCQQALEEAMSHGLCGDDILGSDIGIQIYNVLGAGSYIVGEETAMLNSLEGRRGVPRIKPPFPAQKGLYGKPTTVNNTETLASLPVIIEKGADWFLNVGTQKSGGTKIFCISGHVQKPGVFEMPLGTPFATLLEMAGGIKEGRQLKAVIPGGSSMKVLKADEIINLTMDYESLQSAGSGIGSGGVIVMDDSTCMVETLVCISHFYKMESCGQCTPCREGSGWVWRVLNRICQGQGRLDDLPKLMSIAAQVEGRTICAFGEAFSWPVQSFIEKFYDEFEYFILHKKSMITGVSGGVGGYE